MSGRVDGQETLRKGDRFRFTKDYYVDVKGGTRRLVGAEGVEGRVIWHGKSFDNPRFGVWRLGVIVPGRDKPSFINQRYMEKL